MFNIFKKNKKPQTKISFKDKLHNTKQALNNKLSALLSGKTSLSDQLIEELETVLLSADIGIHTTDKIISLVKEKIHKSTITDNNDLYKILKPILNNLLISAKPLIITNQKPFVILVVGVNGAGKTTTIGKLAKQFQQQDKSVVLVAGDTFRAAAVEQLKIWGQRNNIPVIAQKTGADSSAVIYDGLSSATSKNIDILIADTAGRLHTQQNLMAELQKIKRALSKNRQDAPNETMLIIDGSIGGNAVEQAKVFHNMIGLDSVSITKLDGTAKGGVLFAICCELNLPIRYIGMGESIDDLEVFDKNKFIDAIL